MKKNVRFALLLLLALVVVGVAAFLLHGSAPAVLNPRGIIALKERNLIITATLLMLIVVIPVLILTFVFAWKYREDNTKEKYAPDRDHNTKLEFTWWAIPCAIIVVLAVIAWNSSHQLDPFKPLASTTKPITIQVVALRWKWLFIYPEQNIASVNFVQFPVDTPINFVITADAPMNSFWIPQLGGQVYAMAGMSTQLHLMADSVGSFAGSSANISGEGFAGMHFTAKATSQADFDHWTETVKLSPNYLGRVEYGKLAQPSSNNPVSGYSSEKPGLYNDIVMQFMKPGMELQ